MRSLCLLTLGLILMLGACVREEDFLNKIKGKATYYENEKISQFSEDGETYDNKFKFQKATDENTGVYTYDIEEGKIKFTFTTSDGKIMKVVSTLDKKVLGSTDLVLKDE